MRFADQLFGMLAGQRARRINNQVFGAFRGIANRFFMAPVQTLNRGCMLRALLQPLQCGFLIVGIGQRDFIAFLR